jgi:hypothetical protein
MDEVVQLHFSDETPLTWGESPLYRRIRLVCHVTIWSGHAWSSREVAYIDTGAPVTVVPFRLWRALGYLPSTPSEPASYAVGGVSRRGRFGRISLSFSTPHIHNVCAFLCGDDSLPLHLGMTELLLKGILVGNYSGASTLTFCYGSTKLPT